MIYLDTNAHDIDMYECPYRRTYAEYEVYEYESSDCLLIGC